MHAELPMFSARAEQPPVTRPGAIVRAARKARGLSLAELGQRTGYSASQVSRYERDVTPMTDIAVLRRFADALSIPSHVFGLTAARGLPSRHGHPAAGTTARPASASSTVTGRTNREDGEEGPVRRRQLMANLAMTAAAAATAHFPGPHAIDLPQDGALGDLLVCRVRDAMLGLAGGPDRVVAGEVAAGLAAALADFQGCRYSRLAVRLPRLISAGHLLAADADTAQVSRLLAGIYTLATRLLIKLDDQQLGWMAGDRAKIFAAGGGDPLLEAEAARNLAVLARKAGWHAQAATIALTAAGSPGLRGSDPRLAAGRGLLIQSAAYTAARAQDSDGMRELTSQALALAEDIGGGNVLRDQGEFSPATVALHLISAETFAGDPSTAVATAVHLVPASLPTTERRARYWTDTARAYARWGRRDEAVNALLAASTRRRKTFMPDLRSAILSVFCSSAAGPALTCAVLLSDAESRAAVVSRTG